MAHHEQNREIVGRGIYARDIDPLSLHGSDSPGLVLVTNQLTGANYLHWSRAMKLALSAKSKLGFIDGSIAIPEIGSEEYNQYQKMSKDAHSIVTRLESVGFIRSRGFIGGKWTNAYNGKMIEVRKCICFPWKDK